MENKEERIEKERKRLEKIYAKIEKNRKDTIRGLVERAAFMRISLTELELFLNDHGFTEPFSQGDQEPYSRKRPEADLYNTMNSNYQKIIKQLTDLLPKEDTTPAKVDPGGDDFDRF